MNEPSGSDRKIPDHFGIFNDTYHIYTKESVHKQLYFKHFKNTEL